MIVELLIGVALAYVLIRYVPFAGCLLGVALAIAIPVMLIVFGVSAIVAALAHPSMGGLLVLLFVIAIMLRVRATRLRRPKRDDVIDVEWREINPPEERR